MGACGRLFVSQPEAFGHLFHDRSLLRDFAAAPLLFRGGFSNMETGFSICPGGGPKYARKARNNKQKRGLSV